MTNIHHFARNADPEQEEAVLRQEAVDAAYRALTHGVDGIRNFPVFMMEIFERRAWERERIFAGGSRQEPISFSEFVHQPYPVGLGTTFDAIERLIRGDVKLLAAWTEVTKRPQGERTDLVDNIHEVVDRPTGTSAAAGLRKLQKAASEGNDIAGAQLTEAVEGRKSVHAACVEAGLRKSTKIDPDIRDRAARALAERIVANFSPDELDAAKADAFACGAKALGIELTNLIGSSIMDRRFG